jgi:hypothetical protein
MVVEPPKFLNKNKWFEYALNVFRIHLQIFLVRQFPKRASVFEKPLIRKLVWKILVNLGQMSHLNNNSYSR